MRCPECGAITEEIDGPTHKYMVSSPGCWHVYGQILEKEFSDPAYNKAHRLTVDSYACQHVGDDDSGAIQSVNVHLVALYLALEKKWEFQKISPVMDKLVKKHKNKFTKLKAPAFDSALKVTDIVDAYDPDEHYRLVNSLVCMSKVKIMPIFKRKALIHI